MKTTILLALLLASGAAQASEWVSLGKSTDGSEEVLVDVSRIRIKEGIRQAWIESRFAPHTTRGVGNDGQKWQQSTVALYSYNCSDEAVRLETYAIYFEDGRCSTLLTFSSGQAAYRQPSYQLARPLK
jgi:hypothetical protein